MKTCEIIVGTLLFDPNDQQIGIIFEVDQEREHGFKVYWPNFFDGFVSDESLSNIEHLFQKISQ
jgi:hypothetical protein